jgi:hypothetical protein
MKILASALVDAVKTYLHSGYVSSSPRPIDPEEVFDPEIAGEVTMQIDMVEALRLQGEAAAAAAMPDGGAAVATAVASGSVTMVGAAAAATVGAAGLGVLHRRLGLRPRMAMAAGALAGLMTAGQLSCNEPDDFDQEAYEKSLPAPWEGVELRAYADPEAATRAILHAIICSGIKGVDFPVRKLRHIQLEVGLPTDDPTEGMAYALKTYGLDGWGRELDFRVDVRQASGWTYRDHYVTSAGADGELRTEDDIVLDVGVSSEDAEEGRPGQRGCGAFLRRDADGSLVGLFHRVRGDFFLYNHEDEAEAVTGGDLFDMFTEADLSPWLDTLEEHFDTAAAEVDHDPILFQLRGAVDDEGV